MRILGLDYGERKTGVAISDETEFLASTLCTVITKNADEAAENIARIYKEQDAKRIVLGLPKNMDGSSGFRVKQTLDFKEKLEAILPNVDIVLYDERMTTLVASQYMNIVNIRGKKRKNTIDELAAKIILQDYLDSKK